MENKTENKFPEDDFNLDEFKSEFDKYKKTHYYEKNKSKFNALFFMIMLVASGIAFFIYMLLQDYITAIFGIG